MTCSSWRLSSHQFVISFIWFLCYFHYVFDNHAHLNHQSWMVLAIMAGAHTVKYFWEIPCMCKFIQCLLSHLHNRQIALGVRLRASYKYLSLTLLVLFHCTVSQLHKLHTALLTHTHSLDGWTNNTSRIYLLVHPVHKSKCDASLQICHNISSCGRCYSTWKLWLPTTSKLRCVQIWLEKRIICKAWAVDPTGDINRCGHDYYFGNYCWEYIGMRMLVSFDWLVINLS